MFLILHVAEHPDTSAQAQRLGNVLKGAGVPATVFGAKETTHNKINADLGQPNDPAPKALFWIPVVLFWIEIFVPAAPVLPWKLLYTYGALFSLPVPTPVVRFP